MPSSMVASAIVTPRSDRSAARGPSSGCAAINEAVAWRTSSREAYSRPSCAKKEPPSGRITRRTCARSCASAAESEAAALSASSGVAPSITISRESASCGNSASAACSCCRHATFGEISAAVSVIIAKCVAANNPASTASAAPIASVAQGRLMLAAISAGANRPNLIGSDRPIQESTAGSAGSSPCRPRSRRRQR